jgi:hypothetical protein
MGLRSVNSLTSPTLHVRESPRESRTWTRQSKACALLKRSLRQRAQVKPWRCHKWLQIPRAEPIAASSLWRSWGSSSSARTVDSLPDACCARTISCAWPASSACTISMPKPALSLKKTANWSSADPLLEDACSRSVASHQRTAARWNKVWWSRAALTADLVTNPTVIGLS